MNGYILWRLLRISRRVLAYLASWLAAFFEGGTELGVLIWVPGLCWVIAYTRNVIIISKSIGQLWLVRGAVAQIVRV